MTIGSSEKMPRKRGRPATGRHPITALRLAPALKSAIESWAKQQNDKPKRSEAIRRLIEFALATKAKGAKVPLIGEGTGGNLLKQKHDNVTIFLPVQCRMARGALGLGIRDLAAVAKVSVDTVLRFERGEELKERTVEAIRRALEDGGVEFTNGEQPGVRLRKGTGSRAIDPTNEPKPVIDRRSPRRARKL